jgi:hypothetical protein
LESIKALDRVFLSGNLPADIEERRSEIYANINLISASRKFGADQISEAQKDVTTAARLNPKWIETGQLLERLLRAGENQYYASNTETYHRRVLSNLPDSLNNRQHIRRALGRMAAANLFIDYRNNDWSRLCRLWWATIVNDPSWLANAGVWSIGIQAFLGKKLSESMRRILFN